MSHPLPELARQHANHKAVRARLMAEKYHADDMFPPTAHTATMRRRLKLDRLMERLGIAAPIVSVNEIIAVVANAHQVKIADIKGCRRWVPHVEARAHAAYLIHTLRPDLSLPTIGRLLGGKWHTTVLHAVNVVWPRIADRWKDKVQLG